MDEHMRARLLKGLAREDILYFYQPQYDVRTGALTRAEVLLRVRDVGNRFFDTETLVAAAEELGLIDELDRQTFIHACGVLPRFRARGVRELSVNLSPAACHGPHLISEMRRILAETGIPPGQICIEITETANLLGEQRFSDRLREIRDTGVKIAMDDFGKGCSNLLRMINSPFDTLKLDKSLVWSLEQKAIAMPLLSNIIQVAHLHQIEVVAEGVETAEQVALLTQMGCDYLQGYYFSPPVPEQTLFALLEHERVQPRLIVAQ